jgi:carbamoylphosphate synthase large subunit
MTIFREDDMSDTVHIVTADWREADAIAIERRVQAIEDWLDHTEDLALMFGQEEGVAQDLRIIVSNIKSRRNDLAQRAAALRAELIDRDREEKKD